jgi:hypothetical protein
MIYIVLPLPYLISKPWVRLPEAKTLRDNNL